MLAPATDTPGGSGPGAPVQLGHVRELELLPPREVGMTVGQRADPPQDLVPDHRRQRGDEAHRGEPLHEAVPVQPLGVREAERVQPTEQIVARERPPPRVCLLARGRSLIRGDDLGERAHQETDSSRTSTRDRGGRSASVRDGSPGAPGRGRTSGTLARTRPRRTSLHGTEAPRPRRPRPGRAARPTRTPGASPRPAPPPRTWPRSAPAAW